MPYSLIHRFYFLDGITDPKIKLSVLVRFYDAAPQQLSNINVKQQGNLFMFKFISLMNKKKNYRYF